jgi:putative transcriptional regulator
MPIRVQLDRLLAARGMTQKDLAERINITPANLNIFTTGKARAVRFTTLEAICRELNCQPADLLTFEK